MERKEKLILFMLIDVADTMTKPEMETWQSIEQDTSQVSVTSLPDDEKSEQSLTISSNVNDDNESTIVKQKGLFFWRFSL